jgi:hypothetical protein
MAEKGFKRKLTAIRSADVVGYSRQVDEDEDATIRILEKGGVVGFDFDIWRELFCPEERNKLVNVAAKLVVVQ